MGEAAHWIVTNMETSETDDAKPKPMSPAMGVKWQSQDPRTGIWMPYDETVADSLEKQYQAGERRGKIVVAGRFFTVDFNAMEQINNMGYGRSIERIAPLAESEI